MGESKYVICVNGQEAQMTGSCSVFEYLERTGFDQAKVAVEKNGKIVPKAQFTAETLSDGDRLEIVAFVGGG